MKKRILAALLAMLYVLMGLLPWAEASNEVNHEEDISLLLTLKKKPTGDIAILISAVTICVDHFEGKTALQYSTNKSKLQSIQNKGVKGIISSLDEITPDNPQLSGKNHRSYTHQGWDYEYDHFVEGGGDRANWKARKNLLTQTAKSLLPKDKINDNQIDHFCAILYYIHILGDIYEDCFKDGGSIDKYNCVTNGKKIPFVRAKRTDGPDFFSEMEKHLKGLFGDGLSTRRGSTLMRTLKAYEKEARKHVVSHDGKVQLGQYLKLREIVEGLRSFLTSDKDNPLHDLFTNAKWFFH